MHTGDVDLPERAHDGSFRVGGFTPESGLRRVGGGEGERGKQEGSVGLGLEEELMSFYIAAAVGRGSSLPAPAQHGGSGRAEGAHRTVQGDRLSLGDGARAADDGRLWVFC